MTVCARPGCLGHADERSAEARCTRCGGTRWVLVRPASEPDPTDYRYLRCRAVVAGRAIDPLVSEERRAEMRERGRKRLDERKRSSSEARSVGGTGWVEIAPDLMVGLFLVALLTAVGLRFCPAPDRAR